MVENNKREYEYVDILCIGASISNIFLSYRLYRSNKNIKLKILNSKDVLGENVGSLTLFDEDYTVDFGPSECYLDQEPLHKLLTELKIPFKRLQNEKTFVTNPTDILTKMKEKYPPEGDELSDVSNINTMITLDNNYDSLKSFVEASEYKSFGEEMNLESFYIKTQDLGPRIYLNKGIGGLLQEMTRIFTERFPIINNITIDKIEYLSDKQKYLVNNKWLTDVVIFSGTPQDLSKINTSSQEINKSKELLESLISHKSPLMTLYLRFVDPWWKKEEIGYRFIDSDIGSITYHSSSTIRVIYDNEKASKSFQLLTDDQALNLTNGIKWFNSDLIKPLIDMLLLQIPISINKANITYPEVDFSIPDFDQLHNVRDVSGQYLSQGLFNFSIKSDDSFMFDNTYTSLFENIQSNNNFYILDGHFYRYSDSYVNASLKLVETTGILEDINTLFEDKKLNTKVSSSQHDRKKSDISEYDEFFDDDSFSKDSDSSRDNDIFLDHESTDSLSEYSNDDSHSHDEDYVDDCDCFRCRIRNYRYGQNYHDDDDDNDDDSSGCLIS